MESPIFIAVFKQINDKASFFKCHTQSFVIINDFMGVRRMIGVSITANFDNTLIPLVFEIGIRDSHPYVSSVSEKIITVLCGDTAIIKCHVLPNVFSNTDCIRFFFHIICPNSTAQKSGRKYFYLLRSRLAAFFSSFLS